ncbi:FAD-linked oxidoreductase-like protein [Parasitella parasitica]|nr:FAD-linked oxidoreductase-like protein [Parasitella parasitica]
MHRHFISRNSPHLFFSKTQNNVRSINAFNQHAKLTFLGKRGYHQKPVSLLSARTPHARVGLPIKTLTTVAAVSMAASFYYLNPSSTASEKKSVAEMASAPISAFSNSNSTSTVAQLLDDNSRAALQAKSTSELLLALFVYKLCSYPWIVDAAPHIIKLAETLHLQSPVYWFVKNTFFRQFCGGETAEECVATMTRLSQSGINCILDLSIEADLHVDAKKNFSRSFSGKYGAQEQKADVVLNMIKNCLKTASQGQHEEYATSGAFSAIKVTAFAPPELLLRLNQVMFYLDKAFEEYQVDGHIDSACLKHVIHHVCPSPISKQQEQQRTLILSKLADENKALDYVEYTQLFNLMGENRNIWWDTTDAMTEKQVFLTKEDLRAYDRMVNRLDQVCQLAQDVRVGIMVDAEQSYFQEAIDHVAMNLQQKYNRRDDEDHAPTVYNTYQMYTKAAQTKLERDAERASKGNFTFAAKLVRGAYMVSERKRAEQLNYESPIHETIEDTHASYNNGVVFLLGKLHQHQETTGHALTATTAPIVFMVASHNRESTILTVEEMERQHVLPRSGVVHFGQLFGMQDQISYTLGKNGYSIYKYLPYGMIDEVIPYLLRRAQENSAVLGSVNKERALMWQEVKDRLSGAVHVHAPIEAANVNDASCAESSEMAGVSTETA